MLCLSIKKRISKCLHQISEKRWIDILDDVVYQYNITTHRATNKSPFQLLLGVKGFNVPIPPTILNEENNEYYEVNKNKESQNVFNEKNNEKEDSKFIFEEDDCNFSICQKGDSQSETVNLDSFEIENEENNCFSNEVKEHFEKYCERIIKNANSNENSVSFEIGSKVLLKKDFDNNIKTKKNPFNLLLKIKFTQLLKILKII